jgi:phage shock protein A
MNIVRWLVGDEDYIALCNQKIKKINQEINELRCGVVFHSAQLQALESQLRDWQEEKQKIQESVTA